MKKGKTLAEVFEPKVDREEERLLNVEIEILINAAVQIREFAVENFPVTAHAEKLKHAYKMIGDRNARRKEALKRT